MDRDVTIEPASLTIVGGQPTPGPKASNVEVPKGIEQLLLKAASDESFAQKLFDRRQQALRESKLELTQVERATLESVDDNTLRQMVQRLARG